MNHRFIFVSGLHRSGTSILFKTLRDHPLVSGFRETGSPEDEGQHLQSVFLPAHAYGGASRFGFHPDAHLTEQSPLVTPTNKEKLFQEWGKYWDLTRPYLLEKSPPNIIRTRFLQSMFPDSFFVVIIRHPIAYAFPRGEANTSRVIYSLFNHWLACHEIFREDRPFLKNQIVMRYEDFVAEPDRWMKNIGTFLGIPYSPSQQEIHPDINKKYIDQWERWGRGLFGTVWMNVVLHKFESRMASFGYSLRDPSKRTKAFYEE